jgi:hypothetical protein
MLAKSWIGLIKMRRFGEGRRWGWVRDYWTEPKNGGDTSVVYDGGVMDLHMRMSIKALRNLSFCTPVSEREKGFGQRVSGEQRQRRTCTQGVITH